MSLTKKIEQVHAPQTIGVFGANGFIGRHLVRKLCRLGYNTVAFGRSFPNNYSDIIGCDVEQRRIDFVDILETHAKSQDITTVIQLINSSAPSLANKRTVADVQENVIPHVGFIESCLMSNVTHFIFVSSGGTIYGNPLYLPLDEKHPTTPLNSYGMTKLMVEHYLRLLTHESKLQFTSLRVSNPFGPGQHNQRGQGIVAAIMNNLKREQAVTVYGDGSSQRDYLYIDDLIYAIIATIERPAFNGPLNIGTGIGSSILDVINSMENILRRSIPISFSPNRKTDVTSNILNCTAAYEYLGWTPTINLLDGLRHTVSDFTE